jgi:hypothetical protein
VVWLGKRYKNWMITNVTSKGEYDDDDDEYVHTIPTINQEANNPERIQVIQDKDQNIKGKVYQQLKQLESSFNPEASKIVQDIEQGTSSLTKQTLLSLVETFKFNLPLSIKLGIMLTPRTEIIGELQSRKSFMIWKARRFGKLSRKKTFQKGEEPLRTNGYLRSSKTAFLEQDLLPVDTAKFQALTSMKVLLL